MRLNVRLLVLVPSISVASVQTDIDNICTAVKLVGGAEVCEADYDHHQLKVNGIEVSQNLCDKFTYMVSINTSEFKNKDWNLKISNNDNQISCQLY